MPKEMMNTRELAEYLGIHEKQVYALIKANRIPCTRATGKWLFTKKLIDQWIDEDSLSTTGRHKSRNRDDIILASGSNDPVLDILLNTIKNDKTGFHIFTSSTGSTEGLNLLNENITDIAWCHLFDPKSGEYNIPFISRIFSEKKITVVHLFYRELGLIMSKKSEKKIKGIASLSDEGLLFINRQKGSGTRLILDYFLEKEKIAPESVKGYENEVNTHFEVGLNVLSGNADAGIAAVAISNLLGLPFVPLLKESFDMVLPQEIFFEKEVQRFIDTLQSGNFRGMVKPLGNYDFKESGKIIYSN